MNTEILEEYKIVTDKIVNDVEDAELQILEAFRQFLSVYGSAYKKEKTDNLNNSLLKNRINLHFLIF